MHRGQGSHGLTVSYFKEHMTMGITSCFMVSINQWVYLQSVDDSSIQYKFIASIYHYCFVLVLGLKIYLHFGSRPFKAIKLIDLLQIDHFDLPISVRYMIPCKTLGHLPRTISNSKNLRSAFSSSIFDVISVLMPSCTRYTYPFHSS